MNFNEAFAQAMARRAVVQVVAEEAKATLAEPVPETAAERAAREERELAIAGAREKALASFAAHKPVAQVDVQTDPDELDEETIASLDRAVDLLPAILEDEIDPDDDDFDLTPEELEQLAQAQAAEAAGLPETERLTEGACTQTSASPKNVSSSNSSPIDKRETQRLSAKQRRERAKARKKELAQKSGRG